MHEKKFDPTKPVVVCPGPTSESGKAISSHNATRHGCCSLDILILPTENVADFNALQAAWRKTYSPANETEANLVDQLITADWLLRRSLRTLAEIQSKIFAASPDPLNWSDDHHKALSRFERYRTANLNAFNKCRRAFEDHLKCRATVQLKKDKVVIQQERHANYLQNHQPKPTLEEALERMHRKAEELRRTGQIK